MLSRDCPFYYVNQLAKNIPLHRHNPGIICFIGDDLEIFVLGNMFNAGVNGKKIPVNFILRLHGGKIRKKMERKTENRGGHYCFQ
jgi:hypothetical protein